MPAAYVKIRDKLVKEGKPLKAAKTAVARIYNSRRKKGTPPVTRAYDKY